MNFLREHAALYTDFYQLTMAQGFFLSGMHEHTAVFDYFYRKNPFDGGYMVFAGSTDLLRILEHMQFNEEAIEFLREKGFQDAFLDYLKDYRFKGNVFAVREGELTFPGTPILRVEADILQAQLIETLVLNYLNFQSLIATKAARIRQAAGNKTLIDFGLRRSHGLGGIHASKAAIIGGIDATSNVFAAINFGLNVNGTLAHSWIQSFDNELDAFRKFAEIYPDNCILLADTYDTLKSGIPNVITVAKEMESRGKQVKGVRLDSGDLAYLSKKARKMLDDAGLHYIKIAASNELDEHLIGSLNGQGAPIDIFGIGTKLSTGQHASSLDGVYKLSWSDGSPRFKISDNIGRATLPGKKKIFRYIDNEGFFYADGICLENESEPERIYHKMYPDMNSRVSHLAKEEIVTQVMGNGLITTELPSPTQASAYRAQRMKLLSEEHLRFTNPHEYKVGISDELMKLRSEMVKEFREQTI